MEENQKQNFEENEIVKKSHHEEGKTIRDGEKAGRTDTSRDGRIYATLRPMKRRIKQRNGRSSTRRSAR